MGPRAAIVLALLSALMLCGCANESGAYPGYDFGANSDLGAHVDFAACGSIITIHANPGPDTPGGFVYAPTELIATATQAGNLEQPSWTVSLADGSSFLPEVVDQASGLTVRFFAPLPGSYTFRANFVQTGCEGLSTIDVHVRDSKRIFYKLRVSPPATSGIPQQDRTLELFGGTPKGANDLTLSPGTLLQSTLRGPGSTPIAGEVRLLGSDGPDALAAANALGAFAVAVNDSLDYTPLLIPADIALAPRLLAIGKYPALALASFSVDAGQVVGGTVTDPADAPLAGARIVLRAGKLPSSPGLTAADGSYSLRAQPGGYLGQVGADGWPELSLPSLTVPVTLDVKYLVTRVLVSAKVLNITGTGVAGARVTVRSPTLVGAATATVGGVPQNVNGRVKQVVVSGADGTLPPLMLPPLAVGSYEVLIEPPAGSSDGLTRVEMPLAGAATWSLTLQKKILLRGTVTNLLGKGVGDVKVTAFETAGLGAAPTGKSAMDGTWSVFVDPGSPLEMLFEPPASANLSSARLPLAAGSTQATAALAPGLRVSGYVVAPGGGKLPSVVVEALCAACGSTTPLASAVSDGTGAYSLYLPDPGLEPLDGGVVDLSP